MPSLLWFRRDLRLADNPALLAAVEAGAGEVAGVFVLDGRLWAPAGPNRRAFLAATLRSLDEAMDGRLIIRHGDPVDLIPAVAAEVGAGSVHIASDFGPYGRARDEAVERALADRRIELVRTGSPYLVEPGTLRTQGGAPYRVFTPYFRAWSAVRSEAPALAPADVGWMPAASDAMPSAVATAVEPPPAGEAAAHARLEAFVGDVAGYGDHRNRPDLDGTSRLSPYLKYGAVHPRQVLDGLGPSQGARTFRSELAWREFHADVLWHHPDSTWKALRPAMRSMTYDEGPEADERFAAWAEGRTGFPIVDAGMRQLVREGWMHNRVRMITASFLVKDLHLDWRRGARFFLHHLVDGDLASNLHGWQWVAGTGTDPAPYFRVFNPTLQGAKFDPEGAYVRRYVPEVGADAYPAPIVDHAAERRDALARYAAVRA
jgi:deoxyribodipyrimidine photo-lyase